MIFTTLLNYGHVLAIINQRFVFIYLVWLFSSFEVRTKVISHMCWMCSLFLCLWANKCTNSTVAPTDEIKLTTIKFASQLRTILDGVYIVSERKKESNEIIVFSLVSVNFSILFSLNFGQIICTCKCDGNCDENIRNIFQCYPLCQVLNIFAKRW